jgi:hypothetical protein
MSAIMLQVTGLRGIWYFNYEANGGDGDFKGDNEADGESVDVLVMVKQSVIGGIEIQREEI